MTNTITIGLKTSDGTYVLIDAANDTSLQIKNLSTDSINTGSIYKRIEVWSADSGIVAMRDYDNTLRTDNFLIVKPTDENIEYGAENPEYETEFIGLVGNSTEGITGTPEYNCTNADGETIQPSLSAVGTYYISVSGYIFPEYYYRPVYHTATLTIRKREVNVTPSDISIIFGDTPTFANTIDGLRGEDTLTGTADYVVKDAEGTVVTPESATVGTYVITVSGYTASSNYEIVYNTGTLTVTASE